MTNKVVDITGVDFKDATSEQGVYLFDLWSPKCQPCRSLAPILEDLAVDFAGEVTICKADVSADPALGDNFGARTLPTLALYRDGAEIDRLIGLRSRSELMAWLESHL